MNNLQIVLLSREAAERISHGGQWGPLGTKVSDPDGVIAVNMVGRGEDIRLPVGLGTARHFLESCDTRRLAARWYRASAELQLHWYLCSRQQTSLPLAGLQELLPEIRTPGDGTHLAVTYSPEVGSIYPELNLPEFGAWTVTADAALPAQVEIQPKDVGMVQLAATWPVEDLSQKSALIIGVGSIGGAAAHALATYGVGKMHLMDPDRLRWHNVVRHVCDDRQVGRFKVDAVKLLLESCTETSIQAHRLDVVEDADQVRSLLPDVDLIVCAADGVAPRRVTSHLARRAGRDALLACVLADGEYGEILRLRPAPDRGCLTCYRDSMRAHGGLDPEPAMDAQYGEGTRHRPMTAIPGDLHLVGQFAAKLGIATLLEHAGQADQRSPGEHAVIALRPVPGWTAPFDITRSGTVKWLPATPPMPGCPTCEAA